MQTIRKRKIENLLRETISMIVLKGEIKDPRINEMVTITQADITKDMRDAKIYVSVLSEGKTKDEIVDTLNHAAGFIQKLVARRIRLKNTPKLTFHRDDSLERGFRMSRILEDLGPDEGISSGFDTKDLDPRDSDPRDSDPRGSDPRGRRS